MQKLMTPGGKDKHADGTRRRNWIQKQQQRGKWEAALKLSSDRPKASATNTLGFTGEQTSAKTPRSE